VAGTRIHIIRTTSGIASDVDVEGGGPLRLFFLWGGVLGRGFFFFAWGLFCYGARGNLFRSVYRL